MDAEGIIVDANALFYTWTGAPSDDVRGRAIGSFFVEDRGGVPSAGLADLLQSDGRRRPVVVSVRAREEGAVVALVDSTGVTNSDRSTALEARTHRRLEIIIESSRAFATATTEHEIASILAATALHSYSAHDALVLFNDGTGALRRITGTNPFEGLEEGALLAGEAARLDRVITVSGAERADQLSPALGRALRARGVHALLASPIQYDGDLIGVLACFFRAQRQFDAEAPTLADALASHAAQAVTAMRLRSKLEHAAMHDQVTGLGNRRLLHEVGQRFALARSEHVAGIFVDLDGFKQVNDQWGHHIGDGLLRAVAQRLRSAMREEDVLVRYGGDEFIVICEVPDQHVAEEIAERVRAVVSQPYLDLPERVPVTASVGVALARPQQLQDGLDGLLGVADQAMYEAKLSGGNRILARPVRETRAHRRASFTGDGASISPLDTSASTASRTASADV